MSFPGKEAALFVPSGTMGLQYSTIIIIIITIITITIDTIITIIMTIPFLTRQLDLCPLPLHRSWSRNPSGRSLTHPLL